MCPWFEPRRGSFQKPCKTQCFAWLFAFLDCQRVSTNHRHLVLNRPHSVPVLYRNLGGHLAASDHPASRENSLPPLIRHDSRHRSAGRCESKVGIRTLVDSLSAPPDQSTFKEEVTATIFCPPNRGSNSHCSVGVNLIRPTGPRFP